MYVPLKKPINFGGNGKAFPFNKYDLSWNKIESMVLFHLHAIFKETAEENINGIFLCFDSKKKIISWFD